MTYQLEEVDGADRPWQIVRRDGSIVFTFTENDRGFAERILGNLLAGETTSLSPEDTDELANAA